jgi:hypothetical protein
VKPFSLAALLKEVRRVLSARNERRSPNGI